mmetsp:Transcript_29291/g.62253  ORF Transcript_29291/g.62253 Transcript_29291/m.62253 type:complete len:84 (+) Transcript_29291:16-267(+)
MIHSAKHCVYPSFGENLQLLQHQSCVRKRKLVRQGILARWKSGSSAVRMPAAAPRGAVCSFYVCLSVCKKAPSLKCIRPGTPR